VLPGTVLAAAAWAVASVAGRVYAEVAHAGTDGALCGFLLVSTWLYAGAFAMLAGAACNAVSRTASTPTTSGFPPIICSARAYPGA